MNHRLPRPTSADRTRHSAATGDYAGTGESDHRDQSSRSIGEGEKRGEIFVAKTAGWQSSDQRIRPWRAIPRGEVFHGTRPIRWLNKGLARRSASDYYLQSSRCNQRSCFRVVARTKGPAFHSGFLRSAQFSMQNGATGRKKTFDLMVFVLAE